MPSEEVIELSIDETNKLRAELGLAPLRIKDDRSRTSSKDAPNDAPVVATTATNASAAATCEGEVILELSIEESNEVRKKLGLKPLRPSEQQQQEGTSQANAFHKPAENTGEMQQVAQRIERARLEREVQRGIEQRFAADNLGKEDDESSNAQSWAAKMRAATAAASNQQDGKTMHNQTFKESTSKSTKRSQPVSSTSYSERELEGLNVSHELSELETGSTTVLTLADAPLLKQKDETSRTFVGLNDGPETLENVLLAESRKQQDGLREKRKLELGMGHAGGYAGFDDDEFEELGGTQSASQFGSSNKKGSLLPAEGKGQNRRGFQIGANLEEEEKKSNDLFAALEGKVISLEPATADVTASDFMTAEEEEALKAAERQHKKKDTKFKKKSKKEKKHKRKVDVEDEVTAPETVAPSSKSLLAELEDTAVAKPVIGVKRRRKDSDDEVEVDKEPSSSGMTPTISSEQKVDPHAERRAKYDEVMSKANLRTEAAFKPKEKATSDVVVDEEPDDAFLNAALAKARRLQRLREMSSTASSSAASAINKDRGADVVVKAVRNAQDVELAAKSIPSNGSGTITFATDDTREFTRALRVRAEQAERKRKDVVAPPTVVSNHEQTHSNPDVLVEDVAMTEATSYNDNNMEDMTELAKQVKEEQMTEGWTAESSGGLDGTTAPVVGRGLSSVISMLQQTGEISGKRSGKEELRGRAKDKRHYEDYEPLVLSSVVRIDKRFATDKDKEMASREIKLEYRDKHGRLLTRKEAYRDLCYQFHGHGSSKKREDKRMRQIALEQAEARLASRQVAIDGKGSAGTTLGALKATQEATGKAFVVHKT